MPEQLDYTQLGYDRFFRKQADQSAQNFGQSATDDITASYLYSSQPSVPQDGSLGADPSSITQIPGNNVVGGIIRSANGNLSIDLNQGIFNYTDGVQTLMSASPTNGIQINDNNGNPLVNTNPSNSTQTVTNSISQLLTNPLQ